MDYRKHMAEVRAAAAARGATVTTYLATLTDHSTWVVVCEGDHLTGDSRPVVVATGLKVALGRLACVPLCRSDGRPLYLAAATAEEAMKLVCDTLEVAYHARLAHLSEDKVENEDDFQQSRPASLQTS